jgi:hypothetical protein
VEPAKPDTLNHKKAWLFGIRLLGVILLLCVVCSIKNSECGAVLVSVQGSILRYAFGAGFTW